MKKSKLVIIISIVLLMVSGCKSNISSPDTTPSGMPTITPSKTPGTTSSTPTTTPSKTPSISTDLPGILEEELSMEAYESFLKNEATLSFDRFMTNGYFTNSEDYEKKSLFEKGKEYTLSEILQIITSYYLEYSADQKINYIDYSYIDCGNDGVKELIIRFNGMDIYSEDDDSTLVYIIKYINGKLNLCYYYETWPRSDSWVNEYGYYISVGSGGASNHVAEYALIDKEGNWQPIVYIESETDINQMGVIAQLAAEKGIKDNIQIDTIRFNYNAYSDYSDEDENSECFYTFYIFDENWEPILDANLYTNSIYKDIFDDAKIPFITPDELLAMISEREKIVGASEEIKEGADITWKTLSRELFSDYVEK